MTDAAWELISPAAAHAGALAAAPRDLRVLWALAAGGHGVAWYVWRIGPASAPDGWTLDVTPPGAARHRYTWVRSGSRMLTAGQSEIERGRPDEPEPVPAA